MFSKRAILVAVGVSAMLQGCDNKDKKTEDEKVPVAPVVEAKEPVDAAAEEGAAEAEVHGASSKKKHHKKGVFGVYGGAPFAGAIGNPFTSPFGAPITGYPGAPFAGLPGAPFAGLPGAPFAGYPGAPFAGYPGAPFTGYPGAPFAGYPGAPFGTVPGAPFAGPVAGLPGVAPFGVVPPVAGFNGVIPPVVGGRPLPPGHPFMTPDVRNRWALNGVTPFELERERNQYGSLLGHYDQVARTGKVPREFDQPGQTPWEREFAYRGYVQQAVPASEYAGLADDQVARSKLGYELYPYGYNRYNVNGIAPGFRGRLAPALSPVAPYNYPVGGPFVAGVGMPRAFRNRWAAPVY